MGYPAIAHDPTTLIDYLRSVEHAEVVGEDVLAGRPATKYRVTGPDPHVLVTEASWSGGGDEAPVHVWIGEDGRIRRLRMVLRAPAGTGSHILGVHHVRDFLDEVPTELDELEFPELGEIQPLPDSLHGRLAVRCAPDRLGS